MLDDFDLEAAIEQASDCPHNAIVGGNPDHGDGVDPMMFEACEELLSWNLEGSVDDGDILIRVAGEQFCAIFAFAAVDEQIVLCPHVEHAFLERPPPPPTTPPPPPPPNTP